MARIRMVSRVLWSMLRPSRLLRMDCAAFMPFHTRIQRICIVHYELINKYGVPRIERAADVSKDRFDDTESLTISASPLRGIDLLFHLLRVGLRRIGGPAREEHHLPRQRALRMT